MRVWLFDIDGTLIASGGAGQSATFDAVSAAFQRKVRTEGITFAGRTDRAISADVFRLNEIDDTEANWEIFRAAYLQQLSLSLQVRAGRILPGVIELLDHLEKRAGHKLGLLTGNLREGAEKKLVHYGLWHRFGFGGFGDHHQSRDDVARDAFESARAHVDKQLEPDQVWVVGDTVHDVTCARAIGARVVAVATGGSSYESLAAVSPDFLIRDLCDSDVLNQILTD